MKIGIMAAMPEEVHTIHHDIKFKKTIHHAERNYYFGTVNSTDIILVCSRCGKVSAAITATTLIEKFQVDKIIFTGVAGAVDNSLNIGDVVLSDTTYQHDMDGTPQFPRFEIPLSGRSIFKADDLELQLLKQATNNFLTNIYAYVNKDDLASLIKNKPKVYIGTIATGDQFIKDAANHHALKHHVHPTLAVEMEGAALAQVCAEFNIPYSLIRTISDKADHSAAIDFPKFLTKIASHYSSGVLQEYLKIIAS